MLHLRILSRKKRIPYLIIISNPIPGEVIPNFLQVPIYPRPLVTKVCQVNGPDFVIDSQCSTSDNAPTSVMDVDYAC
jgi:hypothetical protein